MSTIILKRTYISVLCFFSLFFNTQAQKHQERFETIDILNYKFDIQLSDTNNQIEGTAEIKIRFKKAVTTFVLDFVKKKSNGKGMSVYTVSENKNNITSYTHDNNQLIFNIDATKQDEIRIYTIQYKGIPEDGLIISKNKYNERTFFGDNWPDRSKNWLPVVDHPSDKATVEWVITAPSHYQTIGNGMMVEKTNISDNKIITRWRMVNPIPTKVMVIGAARFAVEEQGEIYGIPVSSWVYPQDREKGFSDYTLATPIIDYMINHIGPFPFKKLANVQSKTRFGGMENAGNIFYAERSVTGTGSNEALIAHEVAHQWFGNSASELNWHHIWLSEGFATYFTNLYFENKYGRDQFVDRIKAERLTIIDYTKKNPAPIVNPNIEDYMQLLNPYSYQKGGWILHMLRRELGDQLFWKSIRTYYETYKYSNALSEDLQRIMEHISGKDLSLFFKQWLYQIGHPKLEATWDYKNELLQVEIHQNQKSSIYNFPLDIKITYKDGTMAIETVMISEKIQISKIVSKKQVTSIELDPNTWLLFELISLNKK
ncbi:peptidase M1-like protein [Aquimarina sp. MAR_2010_214]|uniref:M1 family metallopeptidase n=1 Tax=Aquimarina sp. MAR_2010_214 TaxID=1250026 RepID=UPI000C6FCE6A|nr:M1 family metallopeptidase [Aquimarina sp. MAR_2010_214]PKV49067.1 peptidase M1-like protein [Aquimarina sp. MAR_2010_214]